MIDEDAVLAMFSAVYPDTDLYHEYDYDELAVIVYKDNEECWCIALVELLFQFLTQG